MGFIWLRVLVHPVCFFILYLKCEAFVIVGWLLAVQENSSGGWITKEPFLCFWQQNIFCHLQSMHTTFEASLASCSVHAQDKAARLGSDPLISCLVPMLRMCGSICAALARLYILTVWCLMTLGYNFTWCEVFSCSWVMLLIAQTVVWSVGCRLPFKVMHFFTSNSEKMLFQVMVQEFCEVVHVLCPTPRGEHVLGKVVNVVPLPVVRA